MKKIKALCLLSGGLDSRLACKIMQEQCETEAAYFDLPFGSYTCLEETRKFAVENSVKLHIVDAKKGVLFKKYVEMLQHPKHGYGSAINPCIDCHIFILKEANKIAKKIGAKILVTGEVLNERPMSQYLSSLNKVENESGLQSKLLRPLSAKLLPETEAEKKGLINRERFFSIQGRNRKEQIKLATDYKIEFPHPAGGCKLCEKEFAIKVRDLFKNEKKISPKDVELLRIGRHFRIDGIKIIVGRNEEQNKYLVKIAGKKDILLESEKVAGPTTLIQSKEKIEEKILKKAAEITAYYSDSKTKEVFVSLKTNGKIKGELKVNKISQQELESLRLNR